MAAKTKKQGGLVLTRKTGQSIVVNGPARITVSEARGRYVKLYVEADRMTIVLRGELAEKARQQ